ncbi:Tfx family DNA-binding protein [Halodesulfurarchaeum sp.]|uniref:Tfx family DNA-binding protein n=1 Tax=Halodesulfurarchaeum sp. TaxID=1980530 RepID=UPI001BC344BA|nr:Tfx family DNA-binding protein [Halodesulfurarchaeum sp.]
MVEVSQDVSGTFLTERQVAVIRRREDGATDEEIATALDTTVAGVEQLEETALENIQRAYRTVRVAESLRSDVRVQAEAGMALLDVVRELRSAGDLAGIQLGTTESRLHDELAEILEPVRQNNTLTEDVELAIDNDGAVSLAKRSQSVS